MPSKPKLILAAVVIVVLVSVWWFACHPQTKPVPHAIVQSRPAVTKRPPPSVVVAPPAPAKAEAPARAPEPPAQSNLAATARMYAAHASLRVPEVADPDSKTNREILQTMVTKALARERAVTQSHQATN